MKKLTFNLSQAEGACTPGLEAACKIFNHANEYTLQDMVKTGLPISEISWLIYTRAKRDSSTMPLLISWATRCADIQRIKIKNIGTPSECGDSIKQSMKQWAKGRPTSKGARQWAHSVLLDIIEEGEF